MKNFLSSHSNLSKLKDLEETHLIYISTERFVIPPSFPLIILSLLDSLSPSRSLVPGCFVLGVRSSGVCWEPPEVVKKPQAWCKVWSSPSRRPHSGIGVSPCVGEAQGEYGEHNRALECLGGSTPLQRRRTSPQKEGTSGITSSSPLRLSCAFTFYLTC